VRTTAPTAQRPPTLLAAVPVVPASNSRNHQHDDARDSQPIASNIDNVPSLSPLPISEAKVEQEPTHQAPQANPSTPLPIPEKKQPIPIRRGLQEGPPDNSIILDLLQGGAISASLPGYEERAAQVEMANLG